MKDIIDVKLSSIKDKIHEKDFIGTFLFSMAFYNIAAAERILLKIVDR